MAAPVDYKSKTVNLYDGTHRFKIDSAVDMLNGLPQGSPVYSLEYKAADGSLHPISVSSLYIELNGNQQSVASTFDGLRFDFDTEKNAKDIDSEDLWAETERLDGLIYQETVDRVSAITGLVNGIIADNADAIDIKADTIRTDLMAETAARALRDTQLTNLLTAESFDRLSADTAMGLRVGTEEAARLSGDNYLVVQLAQEVSDRGVAVQAVQTAVTAEAKTRGEVDTQLQFAINAIGGTTLPTLTLAYEAADAIIRADLVQEVADRKAKDGLQDSALQTEVTTRQTAVTETKALVTAEYDRAYQAEAALNSRVDFVIANTTPGSLDSLAEIVAKFNTDGITYADRLTFLEGVVAALVNQSNP